MTLLTLEIKTTARNELQEITHAVRQAVRESGMKNGIVTVFCPHTTAAITINENADPDVLHDLLKEFDRLVPSQQPYFRHGEGNSDSHLKSSLVGCSEQVILHAGDLLLGTWQGIYFCEFDGPRRRSVQVAIMGG